MGVVYQAHDPDIGREVAIKLVRASLLDGDDRAQFLSRFRHEARAAGSCTHPNIVAIYDFAMHEGDPFLAMEYVNGVGLGQALKGVGKFAPPDAVAIALQVLGALSAAHALGIVHRDVKPANILLMPSGQVKVTDFGISRIDTSDLTMSGAIVGTPAYMSPEQCRGETVDARSDVFSLGTVLYELLSGTRAFIGRNATEITYQLLTKEPPDLRRVAGVPENLGRVLRMAMAKTRDSRYASAQQMADALAEAMRDPDAADPAPAGELTIVRPPPAAFDPPAALAVDDATLDTIERRLARYIGPIARHVVRDAARRTSSLEELCETVARNIGQTAERERFLAENLDGSLRRSDTITARSTVQRTGQRTGPSGTGSAAGGAVPPDAIDRAERALTRVLGPIAKILVRRALSGGVSEAVLWDRLATHIERPAERDAFLKQRPSG